MIILNKRHEKENEYKKINDCDFLDRKFFDGAILNLAQWVEIKKEFKNKKVKIGIEFSSNECSSSNESSMSEISLIQIKFETFKDGRPFTFARNLRKKYGYEGEIRATGHILPDQYIFLIRCGFDSVEIPESDKDIWIEFLNMDNGLYYQP